jgi:hypothetical protein
MLRTHRELLLNYFKAKKEFSSGVIEGLNNKAKVTMRRSYLRSLQGGSMDRERPVATWKRFPVRFAYYLIASLCLIAGVIRLFKSGPPDRDVLLFFLAAAVVLAADSVTRFKFGDLEIERSRYETIKEQVQELAEVSRPQPGPAVLQGAPPTQAKVPREVGDTEASSLVREARELESKIYEVPLAWESDPAARLKAPATSDGSKLTAKVLTSSNYSDLFRVSVEAIIADSVSNKDDPRVAFFLHHTFPNRVRLVPIVKNSAQLTVISRGCFTVGALLPNGVVLALNLAQADLTGLSAREKHQFIST